MNQVDLYDTTLRDGMQGEGLSLSAEEKLRVAQRLDGLGVAFIEAGFPSSNPKERELFDLLEQNPLKSAALCAFGTTTRRGVAADEDPGLITLAESFAPACTVVGKTWTLHLEKVVKVDRVENIEMIGSSIEFLKSAGKRVIYDAEHFFDAFRSDPDYSLQCIAAAVSAGAECVLPSATQMVRHSPIRLLRELLE